MLLPDVCGQLISKAPGRSAVFADTDFAGCMRTRRSTSGGCVMRGSHLLYHWSSTQTTVALSSGEAELTGMCEADSKGIGLRSLCADLGLEVALTICFRCGCSNKHLQKTGVGRVRHLSVADLWIQHKIKAKAIPSKRVRVQRTPLMRWRSIPMQQLS